MNKRNKIILGIVAGLVFLCLAVLAFLSRTNNSVSAQQEDYYTFSMPVCDEPIPVGDVYEEMIDLLRDIYEELQEVKHNAGQANQNLSAEIAELSEAGEEVCNFFKCQPEIGENNEILNQAPDMSVCIMGNCFDFRLPMCKPKDCIGEPCPNIEDYLKNLKNHQGGIEAAYNKLKDILNNKTEIITEDIKEPGERVGEPLRRPEYVAKLLKLTRAWFHASVGEKKSCSLSELEKSRVKAGEMTDVFPMRCADALEQGIYWPKATSEECEKECKNGPTEDCKKCLADEYKEGSSPLAQINYKIYSDEMCASYCGQDFTQECSDCICCQEFRNGKCVKTMSEEECAAFICGGSQYNYVCCREEPWGFQGGESGGAGAGGEY